MNELKYEIIDEKLMTASVDLKDIKDEPITIPISIDIEGPKTKKKKKNIDGKEIIISEYLRNKYRGKNIQYINTQSPYNVHREIKLMNLGYNKIESYYKDDFMTCCKNIYQDILNHESDFLAEKLEWDDELKQTFLDNEMKNTYNIGTIMKYVADIDLIKHIIIPYKEEIIKILNDTKNSWPEKKMLFFKMYNKCKKDMLSRCFWSQNLNDLSTSIKIISRGNYEEI